MYPLLEGLCVKTNSYTFGKYIIRHATEATLLLIEQRYINNIVHIVNCSRNSANIWKCITLVVNGNTHYAIDGHE